MSGSRISILAVHGQGSGAILSMVFAGFVPALAVGCASMDASNQARTAAQVSMSCDSATVTQVSEFRYRAEGCGQTGLFGCSAGGLEPICVRVADPQASRSAGGEREEQAPSSQVVRPMDIASAATPESASTPAAAYVWRTWLDQQRSLIFACAPEANALGLSIVYGGESCGHIDPLTEISSDALSCIGAFVIQGIASRELSCVNEESSLRHILRR